MSHHNFLPPCGINTISNFSRHAGLINISTMPTLSCHAGIFSNFSRHMGTITNFFPPCEIIFLKGPSSFCRRREIRRRRGAPRRRTRAVETARGTVERHPGDALCPESEAWTPLAARIQLPAHHGGDDGREKTRVGSLPLHPFPVMLGLGFVIL
jgi:hypothetical protein